MKKILVPTSGPVAVLESAEYAMRVAQAIRGEIHLLHVVDEEDGIDSMADSLKVFELASERFDVAVQGFSVAGKVVDQIIDYAESNDISLILMGASNGSVVEQWTSHHVLARTAIPVLVMPYQIFDSNEDGVRVGD